MTIPSFLKIGDDIAIVAPSGFLTKEQITKALEIFSNWGLKVHLGKNIFSKFHTFAGTDEQRLFDFQNAIDDKNIKAIFCARGGYGALRIIDKINWENFIKNPKWIIGYSDITVFHSCLNNVLKVASIHGPMPVNFDKLIIEKDSLENLKKIIFGESVKYKISNINNLSNSTIEGTLIGGNLSLIYSLRGTKYDFTSNNNILFIEEIGEYMYHIDRMLQNFKLGEKYLGLKAIILGDFTDIKENNLPFAYSLLEILKTTTFNKIPIISNFPAGHSIPNYPIKFGQTAKLTINKKEIIFEQD